MQYFFKPCFIFPNSAWLASFSNFFRKSSSFSKRISSYNFCFSSKTDAVTDLNVINSLSSSRNRDCKPLMIFSKPIISESLLSTAPKYSCFNVANSSPMLVHCSSKHRLKSRMVSLNSSLISFTILRILFSRQGHAISPLSIT